MLKKINTKTIKLIKFYKLINYNLIYNNKAINRYKNNNYEISFDKAKKLEKLKNAISDIKNCELKRNASQMVFADGNPKANIMFIGEGPGASEDEEGIPFVGRAGVLLDKMLASINLDRTRDGGFNFLMGFQLSTNISSLSSSSFKLFGSPYLSTAHGVHEIYDYTSRTTSFQITPSVIDEENIKIKFSVFDWENFNIKSMDLILDENHTIKRIDSLNDANNLKFNRFFLSANKKHIFSPPAWPDMSVVQKGDFDAKQFMILFGQIIDTMSESLSK